MFIPDEYHKIEITVKNSRFIAELHPITEPATAAAQQKARSLIKELKTTYVGASHVCHAFILGSGAEVSGCSDDGEPAGTAGRPMLDVLKGSGLTATLITVTRYFGGTLLGTGGLVKAYGDAVKAVLAVTQKIPLVTKTTFTVTVPYGLHDRVKYSLAQMGANVISESFTECVTITATIPQSDFNCLKEELASQTNGQIIPNIM